MSEKDFKILLERYQQNNVTEQERKHLDGWLTLLSEDSMQIAADDLTGEEIKRVLFHRINQGKTKKFIPQWVRIAASILLVISACLFIWRSQNIETLHIASQSERQKITLPDGTIIWMKPQSNISYPERFTGNNRLVQFSGEALFEVAKDKKHPFVIESGKLTATVLGTSFNLIATPENMDLTVLTGRVALASRGIKAGVVIVAKEHALYKTSEQTITRTEVQPIEVKRVVEHTEYDMNFENVSLREIAKRIEGKFDVVVTLSNPTMNDCVLTGDFTDHSLEETLRMISTALALQYEENDKEVKLIGEGCR